MGFKYCLRALKGIMNEHPYDRLGVGKAVNPYDRLGVGKAVNQGFVGNILNLLLLSDHN